MSRTNNNLYIFLHIPRTAGTTVVNHIERNYKKNQLIRLYRKELELNENKRYGFIDYKNAVYQYIHRLSPKARREIKVIYGHRVPYGIHTLFNRESRYITVVRNPVKRSVSMYNLWKYSYEHDSQIRKKTNIYKNGYLVNGKQPNYKDWLSAKTREDNIDTIATTEHKILSKLGYIENNNPTEAEIEKGLSKFYLIGTTESFSSDSLLIYKLLGINKFFLSDNVMANNYVSDSMRNSMSAKDTFAVDKKIYRVAVNANTDYKKNISNIFIMKLRRLITLPFTQFIYERKRIKLKVVSLMRKHIHAL